MDRIAGNGKSGTGNILRTEVRQRLLKLLAPFWVTARDPLSSRPRLPHAQEPYPVEAEFGQAIQFGLRNVIQCGRSAQRPRQLRQPDARVDLIK